MRITIIKKLILATFVLSLTACNSGLFEKDNAPAPTPLTNFTPEARPHLLWSTKAGNGSGSEYLKLSPALGSSSLFTSSYTGMITAVSKMNGRIHWQIDTRLPITTGPGVGDGIVVVGSRRGDVLAVQETSGKAIWKTTVPGEILARPSIANGVVVIKAVDGDIRALSVRDGHLLWNVKQTEPNFILRGSSSPVLRDNHVIAGFANGSVSKFNLDAGQSIWQQTIAQPEGAFAVQRMIDIDADPVVYQHRIYVATYQGKIASLDWTTGSVLWNHDISSYTGMTADDNAIYITDAQGFVWSFNTDTGLVNWRQNRLEFRILSAPVSQQNYVVVGDAEGYLHWLDKRDGHFVARVSTGSGIFAAPVVENNVLYALSNNGHLVAYTL